MKWQSLIIAAIQALLKHKLRSLLSILGIVFAVVAVVAMLAIAEGAKREALEGIKQLGTNNIIVRAMLLTEAQKITARERLSKGLSLSDVRSLNRGIGDIRTVAPLKEIRAAVSGANSESPFVVLAVTASYQAATDLVLEQGRFISPSDVTRKNLVCVLGAKTSRDLGHAGRVGDSIYLEGRAFRVVGTLRARRTNRSKAGVLNVRDYNQSIFIPLGTAPSLAEERKDFGELSEIIVRVSEDADVVANAAVVRRTLATSHSGVEDYQIVIPRELLRQAQRTQRVFNIVLGCIAGISLIVGGIGIMNMMLANVSERTREIGIRRAVGANRIHIVSQFLSEAILLTAIGGFIGALLGMGTAQIIGLVAGWRTAVTVWSLVTSLVMATTVGLVSGIYPAIAAAKMDPVVALRQE